MHNYGANELLANWSARVLTPFMLCSTDSERASWGISRHSVIDNKTGAADRRRDGSGRGGTQTTTPSGIRLFLEVLFTSSWEFLLQFQSCLAALQL